MKPNLHFFIQAGQPELCFQAFWDKLTGIRGSHLFFLWHFTDADVFQFTPRQSVMQKFLDKLKMHSVQYSKPARFSVLFHFTSRSISMQKYVAIINVLMSFNTCCLSQPLLLLFTENQWFSVIRCVLINRRNHKLSHTSQRIFFR